MGWNEFPDNIYKNAQLSYGFHSRAEHLRLDTDALTQSMQCIVAALRPPVALYYQSPAVGANQKTTRHFKGKRRRSERTCACVRASERVSEEGAREGRRAWRRWRGQHNRQHPLLVQGIGDVFRRGFGEMRCFHQTLTEVRWSLIARGMQREWGKREREVAGRWAATAAAPTTNEEKW